MATIDDVYALLMNSELGLAAIVNAANAAYGEAQAAHANSTYLAAFAEAWDTWLSSINDAVHPETAGSMAAQVADLHAVYVILVTDFIGHLNSELLPEDSWWALVYRALYRTMDTATPS